jgi:hypothetical protein
MRLTYTLELWAPSGMGPIGPRLSRVPFADFTSRRKAKKVALAWARSAKPGAGILELVAVDSDDFHRYLECVAYPGRGRLSYV